jgi:hypothetical protein
VRLLCSALPEEIKSVGFPGFQVREDELGYDMGQGVKSRLRRTIVKRLMSAIAAEVGDPIGSCGFIIDDKDAGHK